MGASDREPEPLLGRRTGPVSLPAIAGEWLRIGVIGFGGPPAHIALLRDLCVTRRRWLSTAEFEDGIAATTLLPGPASTQLAIYCAWRLRRTTGGLIGGVCFIAPGLVAILILSAVFLAGHPQRWVLGAAAGAGAAVAAVAIHAAASLVPASWRRAGESTPGHGSGHSRWIAYLMAAALTTIAAGGWVVAVLAVSGLLELFARRARGRGRRGGALLTTLPAALAPPAGLGALAWTAFKVGALSYGGGFVIIPLMQSDAVDRYHWLTGGQFLYAVALGQITPGPVVHTVAAVGYAAGGAGAALLAAAVAFAPSFAFVLFGARHFEALRANPGVQAFLTGAGAAAIGAIGGSAVLLGAANAQLWQFGVLALAAVWLLVLRRGVVTALLGAAGLGLVGAFAGLPVG